MVYTRRWHNITRFNIAFTFLVVGYMIIVTLHGQFDPVINFLTLFFISVYTFMALMLILLLIHYERIHSFFKKMLWLDQQLGA